MSYVHVFSYNKVDRSISCFIIKGKEENMFGIYDKISYYMHFFEQ